MFTGIVQATGTVTDVRSAPLGVSLTIDRGDWAHEPAAGESIAVDGVCLTVAGGTPPSSVTGRDAHHRAMRFDVIRHTLDVTTLGALRAGDRVNLEHAATPATLLGGHVVQGHVDGVATVTDVTRTPDEVRVRVEPPAHVLDMIVDKGSVALAGVSLTIAAVHGAEFDVALIPTTIRLTTLDGVHPGRRLNIEADYVAKIVVQWLRRRPAP